MLKSHHNCLIFLVTPQLHLVKISLVILIDVLYSQDSQVIC